jgi:hypothetical protein
MECVGNHYYIGITHNIPNTWDDHINGKYSWTKLHTPVKFALFVYETTDGHEEQYLFKIYILKYGLQNVRSDVYYQPLLESVQIKQIEESLINGNEGNEGNEDKEGTMLNLAEMFAGIST